MLLKLHKITKITKFIAIFVLMFGLLNITNVYKAEAKGFDSLVEYENAMRVQGSGLVEAIWAIIGLLDTCFISEPMFDYSPLNNICLPTQIGLGIEDTCTQGTVQYGYYDIYLIIGTIIASIISIIFPPLFTIILWGTVLDVVLACTTTYVLSASEYQNMGGKGGSKPTKDLLFVRNGPDGSYMQDPAGTINGEKYVTVSDKPFFYHCDPEVNDGGFVGLKSEYCLTTTAQKNQDKDMIRRVVVMRANFWQIFPEFKRFRDTDSDGDGVHKFMVDPGFIVLSPSDEIHDLTIPVVGLPSLKMRSYYDYVDGHVKLCAAVMVMGVIALNIGCSYVPPPQEIMNLDSSLLAFISGTRCQYFQPDVGRDDLSQVAQVILNEANNTNSVYLFLKSDLHLTSTVIGCIQDLLIRTFIGAPDQNTNIISPFLTKVQKGLKQIVFAALTLYISLFGFKTLTSGQPPQKAELITWALKFGFVLYIATGDIWYDNNSISQNHKGPGLYSAILDTVSLVSDMFMQTLNDSDPLKMCFYNYDGANVLSQRSIALDSMTVQMTVWDYVDCTIANYLSFNSCKYSISGMIGFWFITTAVWVSGTGFLLSIASFIYCFMLMLVVFRFAHATILCMFAITILVLIAPLMACFYLFKYTEQTFMTWAKMILGYMLYSGLLFGFLVLMLTVFNAIFYGTLDNDILAQTMDCSKEGSCTITSDKVDSLCKDNNSLYCAMISNVTDGSSLNNCNISTGGLTSALTEQKTIPILGTFTVLKSDMPDQFYKPVIEMMLFALLFYYFLGNIMGMMGTLLQVQTPSGIKGSINMGSVGAAVLGTELKGITAGAKAGVSAAKAAKKKLFGGSGGDGDGGGGGDGDGDGGKGGGDGGK